MNLQTASTQAWTTPTVQDAGKATKKMRSDHQNNLTAEMSSWATPAARDFKGDYSDQAMTRQDGKSRLDGLPQMASRLGPQGRWTHGTESQGDVGPQRLNPEFTEWLMGWPLGWTDFAPVGTEWYRWQLHMLSELSRLHWQDA